MMDDKKQPNIDQLKDNLGKIAYTLDKEYFSRLDKDYYVLPYDEYYNSEVIEEAGEKKRIEINSYVSNIRALRIKRLVFDKEQDFTDCLQNAISIFSNSGDTVAFVFNRYVDTVEAYAVVRNDGQGKNEESKANISMLKQSLSGNFAGSDFEIIEEKSNGDDTKGLFKHKDKDITGSYESISAVCNIPSAKSEKYLSQNLEKVFNGITPESSKDEYTIIVLAEALTLQRVHSIREGLEELASDIYPFQQHQFQAGENEAETHGEMSSLAHTESTSVAISKTHSVNVGINGSRFASNSIGLNIAGLSLGKVNGGSIGGSLGYGYSWGKTTTTGESDTETQGTNNSITIGKSSSTTYNFQSYTVKNILERLEQSLERLRKGEAIGLWKYATYVCAASPRVSKSVANYYRALTQGDNSYVEPSYIKEWHKENVNGTSTFDEIKKYILNFSHPVFVNSVDGMTVNYATNLNTYELANVMALPQQSIQGIPVTNGVSFGREPHALSKIEDDFALGTAYHMFEEIKTSNIHLSKKKLTEHTFITGSTGSGKSNTIYKLLEKLGSDNVNFLVVEPAKGEYKDKIGKIKGVVTYGTNPNMKDMELLRLNPFRFPENIHILEHLDRLVEIFNVCWPMYAAMPAILKDSVERAYAKSGWDLEHSVNKYSPDLFPTFNDVVREIRQVLEESDYSDDNKGDYTGSLVTRLRSLTNGINGLIFSTDDLQDEKLFDRNVIVDLSRVGSTETKSLIMGILVLKLQEHRMEQRCMGANTDDDLKHVTVLEEAHNLLKRTSTEQTSEGSNMLGKSVEMLANSIAEMRTYGEGFIIADQSPGLLDMSVIRNTNTKIILRLPDFGDRELVGKASGLSDNQITEIARLEKGVAAVSQSDWLEPVLCKVGLYTGEGVDFQDTQDNLPSGNEIVQTGEVEKSLLDCIMTKEIYRKGDRIDIQKLKDVILKSKLDTIVKCDFLEYILSEKEQAIVSLRALVYDFLEAEQAIKDSKKCKDINEWVHSVAEKLSPDIRAYSNRQIDLVIALLVYEQSIRDASYNDLFCRFTEVYKLKGGVF